MSHLCTYSIISLGRRRIDSESQLMVWLTSRERLVGGVGLQWLSRLLSRMDEWLEAGDGRFELAYDPSAGRS
jgi:hypothetical protein